MQQEHKDIIMNKKSENRLNWIIGILTLLVIPFSFGQSLDLGNDQILCNGSNSTTITATESNLAAGITVTSYAWTIDGVSSTNAANILSVSTSLTPNPQVISCTTTFSDNSTLTANVNIYTVNPGTIGNDQFSCTAPYVPTTLSNIDAGTSTLSGATITYQWQSSSNGNNWTDISNANSTTYTPPSTSSTIYYRRAMICTVGSVSETCYSNEVSVGILNPGLIGSNQVICVNSIPQTISNQTSASIISPATIQYQWQESLDNSNWTDITNANNQTYSPSSLSQTTYYRRTASIYLNGSYICSTNSNVVAVEVLNGFTLDAGNDIITCAGENITFNPTITGISGYSVQYLWTGPNNFSSTSLTPSLINIDQNESGTYNLSATIGACTLSDNLSLDVLQVAITSNLFNAAQTQLVRCLGANVPNGNISFSFLLPSNTNNIQNISIDWGDGTSVLVQPADFYNTQIHNYTPGLYTINISVNTTSGCTQNINYSAFVGSSPSPATLALAVNQANGCIPHFTSYAFNIPAQNVNGTTYIVSWGDGSPNEIYIHPNVPSSLTHIYDTTSCGSNVTISGITYTNVFQPSVITQNPCSVQPQPSAAGLISVGVPPEASFTTTNTTICPGGIIELSNTSNFGLTIPTFGGATCQTTSPFYWTITNSNGNSTGYNVLSSTLGSNNGEPTDELSWSNGSMNPTIQFNTAGVYTITLYVKNTCGLDIATQTICVVTPPVSSIAPVTNIQCSPSSIALSSNSTLPLCGNTAIPVAYNWSVTNPSGCSSCSSTITSSSSENPGLTLVNNSSSIQTFTVSLTLTPLDPDSNLPLSSPSCSHTSNITIQVYPSVSFTSNNSATLCSGSSLGLNLTTNVPSTFTWVATDNPNVSGESTTTQSGSIINDQLINLTNTIQTITYTAYATSDAAYGSCTQTETITITLNPAITLNDPSDLIICPGVSQPAINFVTSPSSGILNSWTNDTPSVGIATNGTGTIPAFQATNNTGANSIATITVTPSFGNCNGAPQSFTITTTFIDPGTISSSQNICTGDDPAALNVSTSATGSGTISTIWQQSTSASGPWTPIIGQTGSSYDPPVPNSTLYYQIVATSDLNGLSCSATTPSIAVNLYNLNPGSISSDQTICEGGNPVPFTSVNATSNAPLITYQWQNSIDNSTWNDINGATSATYDPPVLNVTTYYRRLVYANVNGVAICDGVSNVITVTVVPDPTVTDPVGQSICTGGTPNALSITASGGISANYNYQWFNGSSPITGANSSTYTPASAAGTYYCLVTINPASTTGCSVDSDTAQITVVLDPDVSAPTGASYCQDAASVSALSVTASGGLSSTYSYQWYVNTANNNTTGTLIAGATTSSYLPPVDIVGTKYYYCLVTIAPSSTGCSTASAVASITVTAGPSVSSQPANQTRCIGGTFAQLTVATIGGTGTATYQWYSNTTNSNTGGALINGANSSTYTPPANLSTSPGVTYYYCVISFGSTGGCSLISSNAAALTVLSTPTLNSMTDHVYCHEDVVSAINFTGNYTSGMTFNWSLSGANIGLSPNSGSGTAIPSFSANNTGTAPINATVTATPSYTISNVNGGSSITCPGTATTAFTITVNPEPIMTAYTPQLFVFCEDDQAFVPFSASISNGMTYEWTNDNDQIGVAASGTSTNSGLSFTAVNNLSNPNQPLTSNFYVTPVYTNQGLACYGDAEFFAITINPMPDVNPIGDTTLCATATGYNQFSSFNTINGPGTSYVWTNTNPSIGLPALGTGDFYFTSTNTTLAPISGTISVIPTYTNNGVTCEGTPEEFEITINPMPTVDTIGNEGLCVGSSSTAVDPVGPVPGTVYTWTNNNTTTGLASNGIGLIPDFVGLNTTTAPNVSTVSVEPTYTFNNITCPGPTEEFAITINPIPNVDTISDLQICAQYNASVLFTSTPNVPGVEYLWTNSNPSIGLNATGSGSISFNATNTTSAPISAQITVTPSFTFAGQTCEGNPETFNIVVLPTPIMDTLADETVCAGTSTSILNFTSNLSGTTFEWTNSNNTIGLGSSGIGNTIGAFNTINIGNSPAQGIITVTPTLVTNGQACLGTNELVTITVNPIPVMNTLNNPSYCFGDAANITLSSNINSGVVYNWTNANTEIGLTGPGTGNISFSTQNPYSTAISGLITVNPVYSNNSVQCPGNPSSFTIQVAPNPEVNALNNIDFCSGIQSTLIPITGTVTGANYSWTSANPNIGLVGPGIGNIPVFTTANPSTTSVASSLVTVTPNLNFNGQSCEGPSSTFTISINPGTTINTVPNVQLCNGEASIPISFSGSGTTYQWSSNNTNIGIPANGATSIASFVATNNGVTPIDATITVTSQFTGGSGNGCNGGSTTFNIEVLPTPTVTDPPNIIVCHGETVNQVDLYGVATNYIWTNNAPSIGLTNTGTTATIPSFSASNTGTSPVLATVSISPSYVSGTKVCTGTTQSYTINVIPTPVITTQPQSQTVCLGGSLNALSVGYVGGSTTPAYQWYNSSTNSTTGGNPISGATSATYSLPAANTVGTTYYYCILTFPNAATCSVIESAIAEITITSGPSITTQPLASQDICVGGNIPAPLSVAFANGTGVPTVQWYSVSGGTNTPIPNATGVDYMPGTFNTVGTFYYMAQVSLSGSGCGSAQSNTVQVNVLADPTVTSPLPASYCLNSSTAVPLSVVANGGTNTAYNYQWYASSVNNNTTGNPIAGANAASYIPPTTTVATTYYYCVVSQGNGCSVNSSAASIVITTAPTFSSQPVASQTVCLDGGLTPLTVSYASGSGTPTFQWFSNSSNSYIGGVAIPGAVGSSYTPFTNNVGILYYYCVVTFSQSGCSSITSDIAQITVVPDPVISTQPLATQTICGGGSIPVAFDVSYTGGTGQLSYQWVTVNGTSNTNIGSATGPTYLPPAFNTPGTYNFAVQIMLNGSGCDMVQSSNAEVIVLPDPTVTAPISATYCNGYSPVQALSVTPSGGFTNNFDYQWYSNTVNSNSSGTLITGANSPSYIPSVSNNGSTYYYCVVSQGAANTGCSVASGTALITTSPAPAITTQPTSMQTACVGGTLSNLTVAYSGASSTPTYQWYSNTVNTSSGGTPIPGANSASYLPPNSTAATTYYYCVISFPNISCTTISSNPGGVTIHPDPIISVQPIANQAVCFGTTLGAPLNISYTGGYGTPSYQWNLVDGSSITNVSTSATYLPGAYNVADTFYYNVVLSLSGNGCDAQTSNLAEVIVMPIPIVDSVGFYLYCNADSSDLIEFEGPIPGTTYSWINDNPGIGLSASGFGNIMPFEVTNLNNFGIIGNITVTPQLTTYNTTCSGVPVDFQIMVNPYQDVQDPQDLVLCHGTGVNGVQFFGSALINNWTNDLPALGIPASGSGTLPAFLAVNNGTQPIVANLSVTPSFNAVTTCPGDIETFTITILPNPNVTVSPVDQLVCSGDLTATINMSGVATSFEWSNNETSIGLAANGIGNIPAFLTTATGSNTTSTITVTPVYTYSGLSCPGPSQNVQISVVPTPSALPLPDLVYCNGDATNIIEILGNASELNWTSSNPSIGTSAVGTGSIASFNVINQSQNPVSSVITVTPVNFFGGLTCMAPAEDFSITVNPTPTMTPVPDEVLCAQTNSPAILFSGNATSFDWINSNTAVGLSATGSGNISSFLTQNTLPSVQSTNISVTPLFTNAGVTCQGATELFVIDILPLPTVNSINPQVICNGDASSPIIFSGNATNYSWINNNASIGLSSSGSGNIAGFNTIAGATNNVANLVVTPSYAYNSTTCFGTPETTTITVLPSPTINNMQDVVACNGDLSGILAFSGTATSFAWSNSNPSIGLSSNGTGNIPVFTNTNTSSNPLVATITVTPETSQGTQACIGTPEIFTITVNPTPTMSPVSNQILCHQTQTLPVNFNGNASSYSWINSNTSIGLPSFGNGSINAFIATNTTNNTAVAQVQVTPQYTNAGATCYGTTQDFTFSVDPIPTVQYTQVGQTICTGTNSIEVGLNSLTPGVSFAWEILNPSMAITGISNMNGSGNIPSMTLINSSNTSEQFNFQGSATTALAGCTGYGILGTITVDPEPVMQPLNDLTLCSNELLNYSLSANIPSTFAWTASNNTNVVGQPTSVVNSNLIFNTLQNNSTSLEYVTYTVTPTSFPTGCVGQPEDFIAEVVPNIIINSTANYEICSGEPTDITLSANLPGSFTFTAIDNPNVQGESVGAQSGFYINDILSNNSSYDQIVTYNVEVTSSTYGCYGLPQIIAVEVHPELFITNPTPTQICNGDVLDLTLTATENANFSWYATQNGLVNGESITTQTSNTLNDNLALGANVNSPQTVQYTINAVSSISGCQAQSLPFSITVNPVPVINQLPDQLLCSGMPTDPMEWSINGTGTNYVWSNTNSSIGLALNGTGDIPSFNVTNTGPQTEVSTITVTPQYINNGFICAGTTDQITITVEPIPGISYTIPNQDICSGELSDTIVMSSTTNGALISWEIINPPLTISGIPTLTGNDTIVGMYLSNSSTSPQQVLFQGTVSTPLNGCITQGPIGQIVVLPEPVIANINDQTICSGGIVSELINSSIPATFSWSAQDNPNVNGESVGPVFSNFIYNTLQNTSSSLQYVNYTITPTSSNGGCLGVDLDFTVEVVPDIILDTLLTPLHDTICSGELTNILLQTNYPANIIWHAIPNPDVTGETTVATASNYISDILVNNTPFNQYVTYYIDMISSPNACAGVPELVTVLVYPAIQLTNATNINLCSTDTLNLNLAATVNSSFTWYATNNGIVQGETTTPQNTSLINDILINSSALTEQVYYAVDVIADNSGCVAYDLPITVNVLPLPLLLNNDTTICSGEYTNINLVTNIPSSIVWNGVFNIPIIGETYANISGNYINDLLTNDSGQDDTLVYQISATANGCTAPLDSVLVIVHDQPDVDFSVLTNPLCSEDTIQFVNLSSPNFDFDWSFGDGATSEEFSPVHIYDNSGIYQVMLIGTNPINNCSAADSTIIVVNKMPDASFYTMDTIGCGNLNATFYANYQATSEMIWDFGDGQTLAQVGNVTNYYGQAGCYDVTLTVTSPEGCVAQETYEDYVCVYENPIAFIGASPTSVNALNPTVQFSNSSQNAISYIWQMGDGGISYDDNPTYTYPMEGADYHVLMTAYNEVGCFDTTSIDIHVFEELIFYVPNTFTPNDDEKNQTFYPVLSQGMKRTYMEFYIYNRWGELVFESHDPSYGWDGTYGPNALECPIGTYTWKLKLETLQTQEILDFHGHVNLIR